MKKKLLSLLLVLCMVLPMVPVGAIVAAAAGATNSNDENDEFVGSELIAGGTNWPVIGEKTTYYPLVSDFQDGWSFVGYDAGKITKLAFSYTYMSYGDWGPGILWLDNCRITRANTGGNSVANFQEYGAGFAYYAPYAGTVNIDASFGTPVASASRTTYFAIYKINANSATLVYPAAGATGANIADAATEGAGIKYNTVGTKNEAVTGVQVTKGDQLVFVWRDSAIMSHTGWHNDDMANAFNLKVTYTEHMPTSTFDPLNGINAPVHNETAGNKATFSGGWDLISHAGLTNWTTGDQINTVIDNTTGRDGWLSTGYIGGIWDSRPTDVSFAYSGNNKADLHGNWPNGYGIMPMMNSIGGYRYTAQYSGTLNMSINSLLSRHAVGSYGYVAVFQNGKMIWPVAEGDGTNYYGSSDKWAVIGKLNTTLDATAIAALTVKDGSEKTGSLSNVTVKIGDAIEILFRNDEAATSFWNSNLCGFSATASIEYTAVKNSKAVSVEDGATGVMNVTEVDHGATFTLPTYSPIPDDFLGWDANVDGMVDYEMGDVITVTDNIILKAVFKTYEKYSELVFKGTNWPVTHRNSAIAAGQNGAYVLDRGFTGGWNAVSYNYGAINPMNHSSQWDSFEYNSWTGGILWASSSGDMCRISMSDVNNQGVGYTYTVPYTGVIRLETSFTTPAAKAVASGGCDAVYFSILKLAADGTATTVVDTIEYTDTAIKTVTAKHVSANAGDTILYLYRVKTARTKANECPGFSSNFNASVSYESTIDPENTIFVSYVHPATGRPVMMDATKGGSFVLPEFPAGYVFFGWDLNGDNVVDYKPGATITLADENVEIKPVLAAASSLKDNLPTYDALNMNVNYHGGWQVGVYDKYGEQFMPYTAYNPTYKLFSNYKDAWQKWGGYYVDGDWPRFAMSTGSMAGAEMWSTIQYTTPMAGEISIDVKDIWGNENGSPATPLSIKFAIYKNGEKIWPAGDEWALVERADSGNLMASLRANYPNAFPIKTTVNVGDKIEFRAEKQNAASHMFGMDPSISYTALNAAPKVTATGVTVKDTFTLNVYTYFGSVRTDFLSTGLKVWTSYNAAANLDNSYAAPNAFSYVNNTVEGALVTDVTAAYAIQNIAVQNMSRKFYVRTYVEYADGIVYGDVVEISVEQYAMNAVKSASEESALKRVAAALLKYNAAVNAYYGIQSDIVVPEKLPVLPEITPENSFNMTEFENNAIVGATLDIKDTVNMVIYIDTDENISGWRLQMDDNASFATPNKYKLVKIDERLGGGYYVTVELKLSEYNTDFYFRIVDELGEAHSGVLTYSVETYVARKIEQEPENEKLINMLKSMLVLCKTANDAR